MSIWAHFRFQCHLQFAGSASEIFHIFCLNISCTHEKLWMKLCSSCPEKTEVVKISKGTHAAHVCYVSELQMKSHIVSVEELLTFFQLFCIKLISDIYVFVK